MSFIITDILENEIQNEYLLYLYGDWLSSPPQNNGFNIDNIFIDEAVNSLLIENSNQNQISSWTATSLQNPDNVPFIYIFYNVNNAEQQDITELPSFPFPSNFYTFPENNCEITSITLKNINIFESEHYVEFVLGAVSSDEGKEYNITENLPLSDLNNTFYVPITESIIVNNTYFLAIAIRDFDNPPDETYLLPPNYQIEMSITYNIVSSNSIISNSKKHIINNCKFLNFF